MSLIVAKKEKDRVFFMADSVRSSGDCYEVLSNEGNCKIHVINDMVIGAAGTVKYINALIDEIEWFETNGKEFNKEFIVTSIIPKYFEKLKEKEMLIHEKGEMPMSKCDFLIGYKDKLFKVFDNFCVLELDSFGIIGCTSAITFTWIADDPSREKILEAYRISAQLNGGVGAPFIGIDTLDKKFEVVEDRK